MDKDIEIDQDIIDLMTEGRTLEAVKALHERMDIPLKSAVYISRSIKVDGQGGYEIFDYEGPVPTSGQVIDAEPLEPIDSEPVYERHSSSSVQSNEDTRIKSNSGIVTGLVILCLIAFIVYATFFV